MRLRCLSKLRRGLAGSWHVVDYYLSTPPIGVYLRAHEGTILQVPYGSEHLPRPCASQDKARKTYIIIIILDFLMGMVMTWLCKGFRWHWQKNWLKYSKL